MCPERHSEFHVAAHVLPCCIFMPHVEQYFKRDSIEMFKTENPLLLFIVLFIAYVYCFYSGMGKNFSFSVPGSHIIF